MSKYMEAGHIDLLKKNFWEQKTVDYSNKRILIVDDFPDMRSSIRALLAALWATKITMSESASSAISRIKSSVFDIILCDYNLGHDEKNGQQMLEELRYAQLITFSTAFIMATAETSYEYVVAAAEFAPDGYIIKPFNFSTLRDRLNNILFKKSVFAWVYEQTAKGHYTNAYAKCDDILKQYPTLKIDTLRFQAELLLTMKKYSEAEKLYQIINTEVDKVIPWARFWLVQAFHFQWKNDTAEQILHNLIDNFPQMVQSYDLLADIQESQWNIIGMQKTLELWVGIAPKSVIRQRRLWDIALKNQDTATAKKAYQRIVLEKRSYNFQPTDMAKLAKVHIEEWNTTAAKDFLMGQQKFLRETKGGSVVYSANMANVYSKVWDTENAKKCISDILYMKESGTIIDWEILSDVSEICREISLDRVASMLEQEIERKKPVQSSSFPQIEKRSDGTSDLPEKPVDIPNEIETQSWKEKETILLKLSQDAIHLAKQWDIDRAYDKFYEAFQLAPNNYREILNLSISIVKILQKNWLNKNLILQWRDLIKKAEAINSQDQKFIELKKVWKNIEQKFPID